MIHSLIPHWKQIRTLPQTYILLGTLSFYYAVFLYFLGFNLWASILGLAIAFITWMIWMITIPPKIREINHRQKANLLLKVSFEAELKQCDRKLEQIDHQLLKAQWQDTWNLAKSVHIIAQEINDTNGSFLTELLETLYEVLNFCREVADCLVARINIKTNFGHQQIEKRLQLRQSQLQEIHQTISQLRDRLVISGLSADYMNDTNHLRQLLAVLSEEENRINHNQ